MEPIELRFTVACSAEHAFRVYAVRTSLWWPHSHSRSGEPGLAVTFEPHRRRGRARPGRGARLGAAPAARPPLAHLRAREDATEVEVTFAPEGEATAVTIVHRGWERLGARDPDLQGRNRQGWAGLLPHYRRAIQALR